MWKTGTPEASDASSQTPSREISGKPPAHTPEANSGNPINSIQPSTESVKPVVRSGRTARNKPHVTLERPCRHRSHRSPNHPRRNRRLSPDRKTKPDEQIMQAEIIFSDFGSLFTQFKGKAKEAIAQLVKEQRCDW